MTLIETFLYLAKCQVRRQPLNFEFEIFLFASSAFPRQSRDTPTTTRTELTVRSTAKRKGGCWVAFRGTTRTFCCTGPRKVTKIALPDPVEILRLYHHYKVATITIGGDTDVSVEAVLSADHSQL
jgi:hypothetical protein